MTPGFSTLHIAATALITAAIAWPIAVRVLRSLVQGVQIAIVAGFATLGWRLAANVDALNRDGVPWVSANDALAPVVTYVLLGMYAAVRPPQRPRRFEQLRAAVAVVALVVNIVAI